MPTNKQTSTKAASITVTVMGHVLEVLDRTYTDHPMADVTQGDAYKVLISCLLSLRTKDEVTMPASLRLFELADTPEQMVRLTAEQIQKAIYPVGFYRNKSLTLIEVSRDILARYEGAVPKTIDELLTLKGVGRKTANLVVGLGHQLPAVCVDTHVHRISNRLGFIATNSPDETEQVLRETLPMKYWPIVNRVLVRHGQETCKPIGPRCDVCPVLEDCQQREASPRKRSAK
ncbi:MAG: endonuclease III [Cyanobacteria bacterium]|nr:endonuclease III [Cyanobacteriota bacterium]